MARLTVNASIVIQLPNPIQPPQFNAPLIAAQFTVLMDKDGKQTTTPAYAPIPLDEEDITGEVLAAMNEQLARVGLFIGRLGTASDAQDGA